MSVYTGRLPAFTMPGSERTCVRKWVILIIFIIILFRLIIYHDFLPTPRRGSHVKSDKTHTYSHQDTPLSPYT